MKRVIFGAGVQGRTAASAYRDDGMTVDYFLDNNPRLHGTNVFGIPVIGIKELLAIKDESEIIVCADVSRHREMIAQLEENHISHYCIFDKETILKKERLVSFSYATENEDVILYHVLKDRKDIFWIDIGSNDPYLGSVTQLFYDRGHSGINVDMEPELIDITRKVRPRDINLCVGVGAEEGTARFFHQGEFGGLSTLVEKNAIAEYTVTGTTKVTTLKKICDEYAENRNISFLKIDVEGTEKEVLRGADFTLYRPEILVVESTLPNTDIPNYEEWEYIVSVSGYHFVYSHGVNRYYVADEKRELDARFVPWSELAGHYCILQAELAYYC